MDLNVLSTVRLIAFYLPQYHPIPENDQWWGKGFTEWTNVAKARPLFHGHYQPHIPADLGYYDLRLPEARIAQAELAKAYGITGFCYWHYWFAGKRLLERPFNEVLQSGQPDFPFCLAWANESWTGIWHGSPDRILIEQTYPNDNDTEQHFYSVLNSFSDKRYITVDGKPLFLIYKPFNHPNLNRFVDLWQELAVREGFPGIHFVGQVSSLDYTAGGCSLDAVVPHNLGIIISKLSTKHNIHRNRLEQLLQLEQFKFYKKKLFRSLNVFPYSESIRNALPQVTGNMIAYPCAIPNWDNTPRSGWNGVVFHESSPELFYSHLKAAIEQVADNPPEKRIVFVKSWNEWAEGNHLEPDLRFGRGYLEACRKALFK